MKTCGVCQTSFAKVFCTAHQAFLCSSCDGNIHAGNAVKDHCRFPTCALCENEVATVFCKNDNANLCETCDAEIHLSNPFAARHERVRLQPLPCEPQHDSPEGVVPELSTKIRPAVTTLNAPAVKIEHTAVTALPKIVTQTPKQFATEPDRQQLDVQNNTAKEDKDLKGFKDLDMFDFDGTLFDMGFDFGPFETTDFLPMRTPSDGVVPTVEPAESTTSSSNALSSPQSFAQSSPMSSLFNTSFNTPYTRRDLQGMLPYQNLPTSTAAFMPALPTIPMQTPSMRSWQPGFDVPQEVLHVGGDKPMAREARVERYREKRKRRTFEKTIRYQSRKAYAEVRPRIKGRFATKKEVEELKALQAQGMSLAEAEDLVVPVFNGAK